MAPPQHPRDDSPIPVTLLTGFLGAGKTTLLNRILSERHGEAIAVVVNEFGDVGIDGSLVVSSAEEIVELANGCVCCTVRGDLQRSLRELLTARERRFARRPFERVLIEASGLAAPGPIGQTLAVDPVLSVALRLDGILTVAHGVHLPRQLAEHREAREQVAYADRILLGHVDRAGDGELTSARAALAKVNSLAEVLEASHGRVPIGPLLEIGTTRDRDWELEGATAHQHSSEVGAVVLRSPRPLDLDRLKMWLRFLGTRRGQQLYRLKGILSCVDRPERVVVQGMHEWLELGPGEGPPPDESVLVLIGRDLDPEELERGWAVCSAPSS